MNAIQSKIILASFGFLLMILSGFWLSRAGKPYPVIIFTFHKLVTLGTIAYLAVLLYRANQSMLLQGGHVVAIGLMLICFIAMLVTGGLLSVDKALPTIVHRLHQILPYLTVASTGITLYLTLFTLAIP
jgi:hypothetical protein